MRGVGVVFSGLPGSGKSTLAEMLKGRLGALGVADAVVLDGDAVRAGYGVPLGFSRPDRDTHIANIAAHAASIVRRGGIAICAVIAPYAEARQKALSIIRDQGECFLVYLSTPLDVCEQRDRKGLYAQARAGIIDRFTGISDRYEPPVDADLVIDTSLVTNEDATEQVLSMILKAQR
jgi:sulfate adenylyltransferase